MTRTAAAESCLQGAGVEELLAVLDAVRVQHEAMDPEMFNDDGTYKTGINQVPRRGMLRPPGRSPPRALERWRAGVSSARVASRRAESRQGGPARPP